MIMDDDDEEDYDKSVQAMLVEAAVAHHTTTMTVVCEAFLLQEQQQQDAMAVLEMCKHFGVASSSQQLSLEALLLFHELLLILGHSWKGSRPGKARNIDRGREAALEQLVADYFSGNNSTFTDTQFRRRFRMNRPLFLRIVDEISQHDNYFQQRPDASGKFGASALQKVTAACRLLAYGNCADQLEEWIRLGESTITRCLKHFVSAVYRVFGEEYLRAPTAEDMARSLNANARRGFPGCLGSIDCWHWEWKNCPTAWAAQYKGMKGKGCVAEMCCGEDLWIWHLFCGNPGSLNDINILQRSPLLRGIYNGTTPKVEFSINGNDYSHPYWLADGIYPELAVFVAGFRVPNNAVDKNFTSWQESIRKDIERAFGVLQARWAILRNPARQWDRPYLDGIVECCVILHNMIVEDEHDLHYEARSDEMEFEYDDFDGNIVRSIEFEAAVTNRPDVPGPFASMLTRIGEVNNKQRHRQLRDDLKHHLFANFPLYKKKTQR
jgi:hypothetical protein